MASEAFALWDRRLSSLAGTFHFATTGVPRENAERSCRPLRQVRTAALSQKLFHRLGVERC